jgi:peptide-methionine (S)-S-oxide reductase
MSHSKQLATLAGGCFWCIESAFSLVKGVEYVVSGYMGGQILNPTYYDICTGQSGHAEVVQLTYDPSEISFREILEIFFTLHNPTQLNYQGNDVGTQYRTGVFYHSDEQKKQTEEIIAEINAEKIWENPVVTEVSKESAFYSGEEFHQNFFNKNPENSYCQAIISPKLASFRKTFTDKLKSA